MSSDKAKQAATDWDLEMDELKERLEESRSEFAILSRACGNWREWPEGVVSKEIPDCTHADWKAAARAILERNELKSSRDRYAPKGGGK